MKWNNVCKTKYLDNAHRALGDITLEADLANKCEQIEQTLRTAANMSKVLNESESHHLDE